MGERDICKDHPSEANTPGCAGGQGQILHFTVVGGHNRQKIFSRAIPVGGHQRCHCTVLYIFPLKYFYSLCRFGALKNDPMSVILFSILACSHRLWPGITHHCVVQHARRQVASNRWSLAKHDIPSCIAPGSRSERIFIDINVKVHLSFTSLLLSVLLCSDIFWSSNASTSRHWTRFVPDCHDIIKGAEKMTRLVSESIQSLAGELTSSSTTYKSLYNE